MKIFSGVLAGLLAAAGCVAQTPEAEVRRFLHGMFRGLCDERDRFWVAFPDLNGDGRPEAIVYLMSNGWCGTGGCATRILANVGRLVARLEECGGLARGGRHRNAV
ncbi:MAG: hypothetical protein JSU00_02700 [Acidobacteria bacterium]|nr:hypothetical protein [Acidobacteriota bacterium]